MDPNIVLLSDGSSPEHDSPNSAKLVSKKDAGEDEEENLKCPICLDQIKDATFLDLCFHRFCYLCVKKWSEVNQSCPLCKMTYTSMIHNVRSILDYDQEDVQVAATASAAPNLGFSELMEDGRRFRYRSTMESGHQRSATGVNNSRSHHAAAAGHGAVAASSSGVLPRRTRSQSVRERRQHAAIERRRVVYHGGMITRLPQQQNHRTRDVSALFFRNNPAATHRLLPWVVRDLGVLLHGDAENIGFVSEFIINLVSKMGIQSAEFYRELEQFLQDKTEIFVRELLSYAKSPFDIRGYDSACVYESQGQPVAVPGATQRALRDTNQTSLHQAVFEDLASTGWDTPQPTAQPTSPVTVVLHSEPESGPSSPLDDSVVVTAILTPGEVRRKRTINTVPIAIDSDSNTDAISPGLAQDTSQSSPPSAAIGPQSSTGVVKKVPKVEPVSASNSPARDGDLVSLGHQTDDDEIPTNSQPALAAALPITACQEPSSGQMCKKVNTNVPQDSSRPDETVEAELRQLKAKSRSRSPDMAPRQRSPQQSKRHRHVCRRHRRSPSEHRHSSRPSQDMKARRRDDGRNTRTRGHQCRRSSSISPTSGSSSPGPTARCRRYGQDRRRHHYSRSSRSRSHSRSRSQSHTRQRRTASSRSHDFEYGRQRRDSLTHRERLPTSASHSAKVGGSYSSRHSRCQTRSRSASRSPLWRRQHSHTHSTSHDGAADQETDTSDRQYSRRDRDRTSGHAKPSSRRRNHGCELRSSTNDRHKTSASEERSRPRHSRRASPTSHGILRDESSEVLPSVKGTLGGENSETREQLTSVTPQLETATWQSDNIHSLEQQQVVLETELQSTRSRALRLLTKMERMAGCGEDDNGGSDGKDTDLESLQKQYQNLELDITKAKVALLRIMNKLEQAALHVHDGPSDSQHLTV